MEQIPSFKVIILGGPRVGKTSILQHFIVGEFHEQQITTRAKCEYHKTLDVPADFNEDLASNIAGGGDL